MYLAAGGPRLGWMSGVGWNLPKHVRVLNVLVKEFNWYSKRFKLCITEWKYLTINRPPTVFSAISTRITVANCVSVPAWVTQKPQTILSGCVCCSDLVSQVVTACETDSTQMNGGVFQLHFYYFFYHFTVWWKCYFVHAVSKNADDVFI